MDIETIQKYLSESFKIIHIHIEDDSIKHRRHQQSQGKGGHFKLLVVSNDFIGMSQVARHRKIYEALHMMTSSPIHALAISTMTEEEWKQHHVHQS